MSDEKELVYIGTYDNEEFYIKLGDNLCAWSFMGLRPETEDTLKERARDIEITDLYSVPPELERYIDHDQFEDDMIEDWYEKHDVQGEQDRNGETYYLGFGTGTDIFNFFEEHDIRSYEDFTDVFDDVNLNEKQFQELIIIMEAYKKDEEKGYKLFEEWQRQLPEYPGQEED